MAILQKINKEYKKMDLFVLENLLSIILEIVKNVYVIFEGNALADYVCSSDVMKSVFAIALGEIKNR